MSKLSRTKGHSFERWVAAKFRSIFPEVKRHLEFQKEEAQGFDLDNTGKLAIQCKAYKQYAPITKIEEVRAPGKIPALVTKGDRKPAVICMYLDDFLKIAHDIGELHE